MEINEINKLEMKSFDVVNNNIEKLKELFPSTVSEGKIDFELLKQELSDELSDNKKEKYQITWAGKKDALFESNKRITKTLRAKKENSFNFENTKNLYIEGDNLEVLKILQESYLSKIDIIYIDPPYNTGNDFIYNDNFNISENEELENSGQIDEYNNKLITNTASNGKYHSDWLSMIYPRLKLARNLLSKKGIIFISIDDNELYNLKKICDEIFGENNYLNTIVVESGGAYGAKTAHKDKTLFKVKDYVLVYQKDSSDNTSRVPLYDKAIEPFDPRYGFYIDEHLNKMNLIEFLSSEDEVIKEFKKFNLEIKKENISKLMNIDPTFNEMMVNKYAKNIYKDSQFTLKLPKEISDSMQPGDIKKYEKYFLFKTSNGNIRHLQSFKDSLVLNDECEPSYSRSVLRGDLWKNFVKDMGNVGKEGGVDFKNGKKPLRLIKQLIKWTGIKDAVVLDFFSGSATTAQAVMELNAEENMNLKYILVQIPEKISDKENYGEEFEFITDLGEERIRRASKKIQEEKKTDIDYGFRVYFVDSSNMKDIYYEPSRIKQEQLNILESNIKEDRVAEDLLIQVMLDLGLTLDLKIEEKNILNNKVFFVSENSLVACFDEKIDLNILDEICKTKPLKIVFRENSFANDSEKINSYEKVKKLSPETEINVI